jgi:hypothetical protein
MFLADSLDFRGEWLYVYSMLKTKLERILKTEKVGSPLHTWAKAQLATVKATRSIDDKIAQMDVQVRAMTWQKREQNV